MVSITNISQGQAQHYYQKDDYYSRGTGTWQGKGAEALGLEGEVKKEDFQALLAGRDPGGRFDMSSPDHRAGTDLTFSAPKSVSILALVAGDERVRQAHEDAVRKTLSYVEEHYSQTRQQQDGERVRVNTGNLVVATFQHETSRELDPQLHTHCVVMNMTQRPDGEWRALSNEEIYSQKMLIGQYFRNELAKNLREQGYSIRSDSRGFFEVEGVPQELIDRFSQRSQQVRERAEELREKMPNVGESELKEMACLDSRKAKGEVDIEQVRQGWREEVEKAGYNIENLRNLTKYRNKEHEKPDPRETVAQAGMILAETESVFTREDIMKTSATISLGHHSMDEIEKAIDSSPGLVRLDEKHYT
ncbi:MAG: MobF family relaxase, partial [Thermodesulfovibrionales bacterium]